jgi:FixJ family two-component response regulator
MAEVPLICVIDDDESVREALPDLLKEFGYDVRVFSSARDFLKSDCIDEVTCLILDIAMPDMSGPELSKVLEGQGKQIPTIYITAHGDEMLRPSLMRQGAVEYLLKPFSDTTLREAIETALTGR